MRTFLVIGALVVACLASASHAARTMDRCTLAREMSNLGVPRDQLARWACIAQHESDYRTWVVGPANSDGSNDYGIFQINNYYWCAPPSGRFSYNECGLSCNSLLTDDITKSVRCAQKVLSQQGWSAWSTWKYCSGSLPSINNCF
ncbi:lysozyme E-like [Drosophila pseudoobscura]|uniref:lysozyme n=1 Tax=Drosophila pseudoobscura pseudoobscura TaxID=46245 RepID=B5DR81_DROPS|nr:lysozyme E [Drosophila pseudoobscura]